MSEGETAVEGSACSSNQLASTAGLTSAVITLTGWMVMPELEDCHISQQNTHTHTPKRAVQWSTQSDAYYKKQLQHCGSTHFDNHNQ